MRYFLFHQGVDIPDYIIHCINQINIQDNNADIYFCSNVYLHNDKVNFIDLNSLNLPDFNYFKNDPNPLWFTSLLRIFAINAFAQQYGDNFIHFDNDVMLYGDFSNIKEHFDKKNYITPHKDTEFAFGFSYINNKDLFNDLTNNIYEMLKKGEDEVRRLTGDQIHEMRLLGYCNNGLIEPLPVHPKLGNIENIIFDPSSWGQYVGGTHSGIPPGFIDNEQIAGKIFLENKPEIRFDNKNNKMYVKYNDELYQLFNLHIHSKKLNSFNRYV